MLRKPPASVGEYKKLLHRRLWWIIVPTAVLPVITFIVSVYIPKQYRSETLILVEPQKVPTEYVRATVTSDVTDRLQTISEEILSRTRLQRIVTELGLYKEGRGEPSNDALVSRLRKDITVEVINDHSEKTSIGAFKISFMGPTPIMAQKVTEQVANLFIQENLKERDAQAQGTSQFIEDEMKKARKALDQQEAKIRDFKAAHMGSLPEQESSNLSLIGQYQSLLQANSDEMDRASQQKVYLQSMLNISEGDKAQQQILVPRSATEIQLERKREELAAIRQKYTDLHPDVVRLRNEVASLELQVKLKPAGGVPPVSSPNDMGQQLRSQLVSIEEDIKARTEKQHQLEAQLSALQGRIEVLPSVQSQFQDLSRDYVALQTNYQSLVEKQQSSSMATELERQDESEQFRILDPANLPSKPAEPNLILINGGGFLFAVIIGVLLALIAEMRDTRVLDIEDLDRYLGLPLMVSVPNIPQLSKKDADQFHLWSNSMSEIEPPALYR